MSDEPETVEDVNYLSEGKGSIDPVSTNKFLVFTKNCKNEAYLDDLNKDILNQTKTTIIDACEENDAEQMLDKIDQRWLNQHTSTSGANASVFTFNETENGFFGKVLRLTYYSKDKVTSDAKILNRKKEKAQKYNEFLKDEYRGLFIQGILASKCEYINKVYEIGTYRNDNIEPFTYANEKKRLWGNKNGRNTGIYGILEHEPYSFRNFKNLVSLEESKKKQATIQLLKACQCIHDNGFVHLDLKPDNIMFDISWNLKIIDFGYSEVILKPKTTDTQGTIPYQCPHFGEYKTYRKYLDYNAIGYIIMQIWYNGNDWDNPTSVSETFTADEKHNIRADFFLGNCREQKGRDIQEIIDFYEKHDMKFPTRVQKAVGAIQSVGTTVKNLFGSNGGRRISRRCKRGRRTKQSRKRKTKRI